MRIDLLRPPPPRFPLQHLPDPVRSLVIPFLDAHSRKQLAHAVPTIAAFRQALRVYIPPDAARRDPLLHQLYYAASSPSMDARFTRFAIVDTSQLTELETIARQVQDLSFTRSEYRWQQREALHGATWSRLQRMFHHLICLKIEAKNDEIDLDALSQSLPKLQTLSIEDSSRVLNTLQPLPELHTLCLIDTNINSFKIAVGLPKLSCLRLQVGSGSFYAKDMTSLELQVSPLRVLETSEWGRRHTNAFLRHSLTLEKLHMTGCWWDVVGGIMPRVGSTITFPLLRSLDTGNFRYNELRPLTVLVSLEELTIVMDSNATTCRPLQELKKLRKLKITHGWLRDIIGRMRCLQQLEAIDVCTSIPYERAALGRPRGAHHNNVRSDLRELSLDGSFTISYPGLLRRLRHVETVKLAASHAPPNVMTLIQQLPRLQKVCIAVPKNKTNDVALACETPFASVRSLEEVSVPQWMDPSIPRWLTAATQLHKLHLDSKTTSITNCPPNLTHLYASMVEDAKIVDKICAQRLVHLRVVSIPREADCLVLRRERREGGALPALQFILHPTVDCLPVSSSVGKRHTQLA